MLTRLTDAALRLLALVGGLAVMLLTLHVGVGVILRYCFGINLPMTYEIVTQYYMVALAFIPIAWVERNGGMVAVELIDALIPQAASQFIDRFVSLLSTLVYVALAWFTWTAAMRNFTVGTYALVQNVYLPLWPAWFLMPLGFGLAALITLMRLIDPSARQPA